MKGKILSMDAAQDTGLISGEDGQRYTFTSQDWKSGAVPLAGQDVDFAPLAGQAKEIYQELAIVSGTSKKLVAVLLAFFFGGLGLHKFYLGYTKQGIIMLLLFVFGFILLGVPSAIIGIIAFVEFIIYLTKTDQAFENIYVKNRRPWF